MKKILILLCLCSVLLLGGCTSKPVENTYTVTVESCMKDSGLNPSEKGKNITYYFVSADEISLYYATNWKKGVITAKKYFVNEEQYNIQKTLYPNAKFDDNKFTVKIDNYLTVTDMDAHWDSIENSGIYTLVK